MDVVHKISVDLGREQIPPRISVMQNDSARKIEVSLYENGATWEIPVTATAYIAFKRPDEQNIRIANLSNGDPVVSVSGNVATVSIPEVLTASCGSVPVVVVFLDETGAQIATFPISVTVVCNPAADAGEADPITPDEFTQLLSAIGVERARITNLATLEEGSTAGDAELADIRVGADGKTYGNAGEAVRGQIGQISETQIIEPSTNKYNSAEWVTGKWMGVNGIEGNNATFGHTGFIPVSPGDIVVFGNWNPNTGNFVQYGCPYVAAYDSDKTAVSSAGRNGSYSNNKSYTVPDGIFYIILSVDLSAHTVQDYAQINRTADGVALPYEPYYEGGTTLYPYGYAETQRRIKDAQADITELESKIGIDTTSINGHIISSTFDMAAGEVVSIGEDIRIVNNNTIEFFCTFSTFSSVTVGHGNQVLYGSAVKVDATKIYILQNAAETVIYEYAHGLTISEFLSVVITINEKGRAGVQICTAAGDYTTAANLIGNNIWAGLAGNIFAKATSACSNCKLVWNMNALQKDAFLFGDSYVPLHDPAQYTTYLTNKGYTNFAIMGSPGATASVGLTQFQNAMAVRHPKLVVWALGMNNADTTTAVNASWLECTQAVIDHCSAHNIELVLATIPNVPERLHTFKNEWVRNSGYRYVDFAKAVGAEETGSSWYAGMLKADNVHPDVLGAKALAFRFLLDVPEIANN